MRIDEHGKRRIATAIAEAEARTAGEIVCLIARQASDWHLWPLAYASLVALAVPLVCLLATDWAAVTIYAVQLVAFAAVALVAAIRPVRLALVPPAVKRERAHRAAVEQFLARGLTGTRGRTGVLIYVAVAEHAAEVIADRGIYERVPPEVWREAVDALTGAIRRGDPVAGFLAAIERVGAVLAEHVPRRAHDVDELPNRLVEI